MYIIAGLGNPGREYDNTRHNIGFRTVDALADKYGIEINEKKHKGLSGKGLINGNKVILVKPQTYMNLSGECLREITDYYKVDVETEFIVIYDDITLDVGGIRVRKKGSAGGHNGMKSIISGIGTDAFMRIRVGIGEKPAKMDLADWVLGHFPESDSENLKSGVNDAMEAVNLLMAGEIDEAMNRYNRKVNRG